MDQIPALLPLPLAALIHLLSLHRSSPSALHAHTQFPIAQSVSGYRLPHQNTIGFRTVTPPHKPLCLLLLDFTSASSNLSKALRARDTRANKCARILPVLQLTR